MFNAPQPRSRLYTSVGCYAKGLPATVLGIGYEGSGVLKLERELGLLAGQRIIAVPMARVGIYLVLKHTIRQGQKVILSPYTISDVVNMVLCAGGVPLFADIEEGGSCNIDADVVLDLLETEDDIGAVLVTHFYGLTCNLQPILDACRERGIPVVEDAAQAFGGRYEGKPAGTIGHAGVFSFGLLKNVTGFLGGAVVTADEKLASAIRARVGAVSAGAAPAASQKNDRRRHVRHRDYAGGFRRRRLLAVPLRLSARSRFLQEQARHRQQSRRVFDVSGALCRPDGQRAGRYHRPAASSTIEAATQQRIAKAESTTKGLPTCRKWCGRRCAKDGSHIYFYYTIQVEERDRLARFMTEQLRDVQISHHRNCASLPCFRRVLSRLPERREGVAARSICRPIRVIAMTRSQRMLRASAPSCGNRMHGRSRHRQRRVGDLRRSRAGQPRRFRHHLRRRRSARARGARPRSIGCTTLPPERMGGAQTSS